MIRDIFFIFLYIFLLYLETPEHKKENVPVEKSDCTTTPKAAKTKVS